MTMSSNAFVCEEVLAIPFLVDLNCLHSKMKLLQPPKNFNEVRDNWPQCKLFSTATFKKISLQPRQQKGVPFSSTSTEK